MRRRLTVRIDEDVYNRINLYAKENSITVNKAVAIMIDRSLKQPTDYNFHESILKKLELIDTTVNAIYKKQLVHLKISKQHFANVGYLSNANPRYDKALNELLKPDIKFYD